MSEEKKPVEYVAFCTECKTVIPDETAQRDMHLQAGQPGVCGLCGGVTAVTTTDKIAQARHRADSKRGLA